MREQWGVLCDSEKNKYEKQAENEKLLFEKKKKEILEKAKENTFTVKDDDVQVKEEV